MLISSEKKLSGIFFRFNQTIFFQRLHFVFSFLHHTLWFGNFFLAAFFDENIKIYDLISMEFFFEAFAAQFAIDFI